MALAKARLPSDPAAPAGIEGFAASPDLADASVIVRRAAPELFILDGDLRVVSTSPGATWILESADPAPALELAHAVRRALSEPLPELESSDEPQPSARATIADLFGETIMLRVLPLHGGSVGHVAVLSERLQLRNPITRAAARFNLSPRERDVLREVMLGRGTSQIADSLGIAETTVADHIKRIAMKTDSHRRSEIIAKVLGTR